MIKRSFQVILLAVFISACSTQTPASKEEGLKPTVTSMTSERTESGPLAGKDTRTVESIVSVEKLDYNTRHMTVKNMHGKKESFTVSPEVKRLNEIKVGDKIALRFERSMAFEVREPTALEIANPRMVGANVKKSGMDLPPGVKADTLSHTLVTIEQIDLSANTVTVRLPEGNNVTVLARYPENLHRIKVGDKVAVTYGEALAIDIRPLS